MSKSTKYPKINLRSKNEIAKRISSSDLPPQEALKLLNDVLKNFDSYWYDSKESKPERGKFVRSAAKSPNLQTLLQLINEKILKPHDNLVPGFVFGGLSSRSSIKAAASLLGKKKKRTLLKLDIQTFFEQTKEGRVFTLFNKQCGCSREAAAILASLCCVPLGPKGSGASEKILARGFSTSPRLAVWCNVRTFQHLEWEMKKALKGHDPALAIYVDDIGVSASRVSIEQMEDFKLKAVTLLEKQSLPPHTEGEKSKIIRFSDNAEHLGTKLGRRRLSLSKEARLRAAVVKRQLKSAGDLEEKKSLLRRYKAHQRHKKNVRDAANKTSTN